MNKLLMFTLGAAAGSLLTWKIVEEKYKKIADEEIQSVKDMYKNRENQIKELKETKDEYETLVENLSYSNSENDEEYTVKVELGEEVIEPFVIDPNEFGEMPGYDTESWSYLPDGVVTDEEGGIVTDYESIIGDVAIHFGEYDDDSVYVRNDNNKCDYEILRYYKPFNGVEN